MPKTKVKNLTLSDRFETVRLELDDLYLEQEVLEDKIRDKENELDNLSERLVELEQDEDASN